MKKGPPGVVCGLQCRRVVVLPPTRNVWNIYIHISFVQVSPRRRQMRLMYTQNDVWRPAQVCVRACLDHLGRVSARIHTYTYFMYVCMVDKEIISIRLLLGLCEYVFSTSFNVRLQNICGTLNPHCRIQIDIQSITHTHTHIGNPFDDGHAPRNNNIKKHH